MSGPGGDLLQVGPQGAGLVSSPLFGSRPENLLRQGKKAEETAVQVEGLFMSMLVREMRRSLPGDGLFGKGPGKNIYEGFFDSMLGEALARSGGLGIKEQILRDLGNQSSPSPFEHQAQDGTSELLGAPVQPSTVNKRTEV